MFAKFGTNIFETQEKPIEELLGSLTLIPAESLVSVFRGQRTSDTNLQTKFESWYTSHDTFRSKTSDMLLIGMREWLERSRFHTVTSMWTTTGGQVLLEKSCELGLDNIVAVCMDIHECWLCAAMGADEDNQLRTLMRKLGEEIKKVGDAYIESCLE